MMKRMRRPQESAPDLRPDTISILLAGWTAPDPPVPFTPGGFGGGFIHLVTPGGIAELWKQHGPWLREQARAWGWQPTYQLDGELVFYGEYVARTGREHSEP
jgi:hypothetical protein